MTGVYLSEVCLIGLFAINTAPGPIILMAFFLGCTVGYHALIHHALRPLTTYLPDSFDGDDQLNMFDTTDYKSYDYTKSDGIPPSEVRVSTSKKMTTKKASLFGRIFNPKKFKSHKSVKTLVPSRPTPQ